MAGTGVIERQIAHDAHTAGVACARERTKRLVAAEQGIDMVEGRGIVAVNGTRRETRREIHGGEAQILDVIEMLLDTFQIAAVPLATGFNTVGERFGRPCGRMRPIGCLPCGGLLGSGEAVGEDLVCGAFSVPCRRWGEGGDAKIEDVADFAVEHAERVEPVESAVAQQGEAVAGIGIVDGQRRLVPGFGIGAQNRPGIF